MDNKHKCPICGEETASMYGNYRKDGLCPKHASDLKNGTLSKDENNKWVYGKQFKVFKGDSVIDDKMNSGVKIQKKYYILPKSGFNKCQICGTETSGTAFCMNCYREHTNDELLFILNNGNNKVDDEDSENDDSATIEINGKIVIDSENKSRCITCGRKTDGLLFCASCYHKYKDKELLFRITNCTDVELLDSEYEGRYTCKDGHIVKSKSEVLIDNYLFENDIAHAYERELRYGPSEKDVLNPDFYLPNYLGKGKHVYIEHWGYNENNIKYKKSMKFKLPIYKERKITLVCTYEDDISKIDSVLDWKLKKENIKENQVNFESESN